MNRKTNSTLELMDAIIGSRFYKSGETFSYSDVNNVLHSSVRVNLSKTRILQVIKIMKEEGKLSVAAGARGSGYQYRRPKKSIMSLAWRKTGNHELGLSDLCGSMYEMENRI